MLAGLSAFCIYTIAKLTLRLIKSGMDDEILVADYNKKRENAKKIKYIKIADGVFSALFCLIFISLFISSLMVQCTQEDTGRSDFTTFRVVQTGSMAKKHEKNEYLFENELDDQIQTFDLIRTDKLPDEMELELYDIVVYEVDDILLVHRIVEIEEPNERHPDCRYFKMQGDAVEAPDRFPVLYGQMRAIYNGYRIPFIGSFVMFMQSMAGWLCMLLIVVAMIATPILEKTMEKARAERLKLYIPELIAEDEEIPEEKGDSDNA
jgi:signal peptidase